VGVGSHRDQNRGQYTAVNLWGGGGGGKGTGTKQGGGGKGGVGRFRHTRYKMYPRKTATKRHPKKPKKSGGKKNQNKINKQKKTHTTHPTRKNGGLYTSTQGGAAKKNKTKNNSGHPGGGPWGNETNVGK